MKQLLCGVLLAMGCQAVFAEPVCRVPDDATMSAVVRVQGEGVEGSGVIIDQNRVLTAAHVIEGLNSIQISHKGLLRSANVIAVDSERDLALLLADTSNQKPLAVSQHWFPPASAVWTIGFPRGGNQIASSGRIEAYAEGDVQTTASVDHGQSGGGLVACESGRHVLAGMIRAFGALQRGEELVRLEDFSVAVPNAEVIRFIENARPAAQLLERFILSSNLADGGEVAQQVARR